MLLISCGLVVLHFVLWSTVWASGTEEGIQKKIQNNFPLYQRSHLPIHSFIYSTHVLSVPYVPGMVLSTKKAAMDTTKFLKDKE